MGISSLLNKALKFDHDSPLDGQTIRYEIIAKLL